MDSGLNPHEEACHALLLCLPFPTVIRKIPGFTNINFLLPFLSIFVATMFSAPNNSRCCGFLCSCFCFSKKMEKKKWRNTHYMFISTNKVELNW